MRIWLMNSLLRVRPRTQTHSLFNRDFSTSLPYQVYAIINFFIGLESTASLGHPRHWC